MTRIQKCCLCDNSTVFAGGFFLKGNYICLVCEEKIITTNQSDSRYDILRESIRSLLLV